MANRFLLNRRTLLRGAGAAVALPMLEAMLPTRANAQTAAPTRLCVIKFPLGYHPDSWAITGSGTSYTPSAQLSKLVTNHRADITLVKGLHTHLNITQDVAPNLPDLNYFSFGVSHYQGTAGFLTCAPAQRGTNYPVKVGTSFDQKVANAVGGATPIRSLVMRSVENSAGSDATYGEAKAYRTNISWADPTTPASSVDDPGALWDKLFGNYMVPTTDPAAVRAQARRVSVLDAISADAQRLETKLGKSDRARLDEYLTNLSEVERRVKAVSVAPPVTCTPGTRPSGSWSYPNHVVDRMRAMYDVLILAFQCDLTRVATYMIDEDFQPFNTDALIPNALTYPHALSHYDTSEGTAAVDKPAQFKQYNQFYFDELSSFLDKLKAVQTPTGALLDSMMLVYGSGLGDTNSHQGYDVPIIVAGKGNGAIKPGKLLDVRTGNYAAMELIRPWDASAGSRPKGRPVADLWLTLMRGMGMSDASFGNSGAVISELST